MPEKTRTNHEIGATAHFFLGPGLVAPQFNWRVHFPATAGQGQLSGLFLGLDLGPGIDLDGDVEGVTGFQLGYEFDPWSNLALTFSPVLHNDLLWDTDDVEFMQTLGLMIRLYVRAHWVIIFEPGAFGWFIDKDGDVELAFRAGWGFAYKF